MVVGLIELHCNLNDAADLPRRIIARPADRFLKIAPGPIFGPWGGQNRIPREKYSDFTYFHNFSTDF